MMSVTNSVAKLLTLLLPTSHRTNDSTTSNHRPLIIGLSGLQGSGKSTWASAIVQLLSDQYELKAIQISLDDLYKTHEELIKLREDNSDNLLLRTRGQPGTHDEDLAQRFFEHLQQRVPSLCVPVFDKSQFDGEGDRLNDDEWPLVPQDVDVVVFEGWCVGFQPVEVAEIHNRWKITSQQPFEVRQAFKSTSTLANHQIEHLEQINENLARYCQAFMGPENFDFFVHLDTDDLANVYTWRLQQEQALIAARGSGMSEQQVTDFVKGYMPAYELYLDQLRAGFFSRQDLDEGRKKHVRVCLGASRDVLSFQTL